MKLSIALAANEVAVTFVNHATVLIQLPGVNILTDPVFSERVSPLSWAGPKRAREPGLSLEQLPKIDIVLLSHNHYDHLDKAALKVINQNFQPLFFVPLGVMRLLNQIGISQIHELDWWDRILTPGGVEVVFTPAQHFSGRGLFDRDATLWGSFFIQKAQAKIYFGGDSAYASHYKEIRQRLGIVDIALMPIGAYEPNWFMRPVHMNPAEAVQAHLDLESRQTIGIHFGTFQLSEESIDQPVLDLVAEMNNRHLALHSFTTFPEGQTRVLRIGPLTHS